MCAPTVVWWNVAVLTASVAPEARFAAMNAATAATMTAAAGHLRIAPSF